MRNVAMTAYDFETLTLRQIPMRIHMEMVDPIKNHDKFYKVRVLPVSGVIETVYGRNGTAGSRDTLPLNRSNLNKVTKKIQEKLGKGYVAKQVSPTPRSALKNFEDFFTDPVYNVKVQERSVMVFDKGAELVLDSARNADTEAMVLFLVTNRDARVDYPL